MEKENANNAEQRKDMQSATRQWHFSFSLVSASAPAQFLGCNGSYPTVMLPFLVACSSNGS